MKKLSILLILFTLFSCSKNEDMPQITTIYYNGVSYSINDYTTVTESITAGINDPNPTLNRVEVTMTTSAESGNGFVFTYIYSNKHYFQLKEDSVINPTKGVFTGDIEFISNELKGKAYDNKGNYIIFSENTSGGGSGLTQEQVEGLIFKA